MGQTQGRRHLLFAVHQRNHWATKSFNVHTQVGKHRLAYIIKTRNLRKIRNLVANAQFVGDGLLFTPEDVVCCPPPLAHCFGLVCGLLAAIAHGSSVVLPSDIFDAAATTKAVEEEGCSVLHAVPVMFEGILKQPQTAEFSRSTRLRTGIVAGSSLSQELVDALYNELHLVDLRYGFGTHPATGLPLLIFKPR